jgi:hypothetical protein
MADLRLVRAPSENAADSRDRFKRFVEQQNSPFVATRPDEVIQQAVAEQSLFFVLDEQSDIVGTSAFYWHGPEGGWGEIGSTLVDPRYQGVSLQRVIYRHIISLKWLSNSPKRIFAVVDEDASASYSSIEKLGFERSATVPTDLVQASGNRDWSPITSGKKRLYLLGDPGIGASLSFVASNGQICLLRDASGTQLHSLTVEFEYLKSPDLAALLNEEADSLK